MSIINKLKKANLVGRGGGCFPTALKWQMVKDAPGNKKYIICNASEGEPEVLKDGYILENFPDRVIDGMRIAIDFLGAEKAFLYINPDYYVKFREKLISIIGDSPIELFKKDHSAGYIGGEETSAINHLEGRRIEPRLRPPFPTTNGLWDQPTLINNVETFYAVSLISAGEYKNERFITVSGDCLWTGVYEFSEDGTINKILKETKNYPKFPFFVQIGGGASGEVLNDKQLKRSVSGSGSITIYSIMKHRPLKLIYSWLEFFVNESCGQCTPCREGTFRLREVLNVKEPDWKLFAELLDNLNETSFCGLGCAVSIPIRSYVENVLAKIPENQVNLPKISRRVICECFK